MIPDPALTSWTTADSARLTNAFDRAGAFHLSNSAPDAALFVNLAPGAYTLEATGLGGTVGSVLVETDRKSTLLNSSHTDISRMPSSA